MRLSVKPTSQVISYIARSMRPRSLRSWMRSAKSRKVGSATSRRPLSLKDLCVGSNEEQPHFWFEESTGLYRKLGQLVGKLQASPNLFTPELDALIDLDVHLLGLWKSFEDDAMAAVERICTGALPSVRLPSLFACPETVYCFKGILIAPGTKGHVRRPLTGSSGSRRPKLCDS